MILAAFGIAVASLGIGTGLSCWWWPDTLEWTPDHRPDRGEEGGMWLGLLLFTGGIWGGILFVDGRGWVWAVLEGLGLGLGSLWPHWLCHRRLIRRGVTRP